jgi:hypothetical protein
VHAPYSNTMSFLSAFFGGPLAALVAFGLNVHRLRRWSSDGLVLVAVSLVTLALWALSAKFPWDREVPMRALALLLALAGLWRHRIEQRTAELMGIEKPNGFWVGLGLVVAGMYVSRLIEQVLR